MFTSFLCQTLILVVPMAEMIQCGAYDGSVVSVVPVMTLYSLGKGSNAYRICRLLRHMNHSYPKVKP